jgi:hypothetical protein
VPQSLVNVVAKIDISASSGNQISVIKAIASCYTELSQITIHCGYDQHKVQAYLYSTVDSCITYNDIC